jgi:Bacterial conjugation TrbI-like protein
MKRIFDLKYSISFLTLLILITSLQASAQKRRPVLKRKPVVRKVVAPAKALYSVETGTVIRARMNQTINSKTTRVGNTFTATVTEPVYANNGAVVVPVGSTVTGRVDSVVPAAKGGKPGQIDASFTQVKLPNGYRRAINGSLTDLAGNTNSDTEGTATGKKMNNRKLIFIGGGGAGGAVLGAAIGGGKGALIGGLLGAGGGFLGEKFTKGSEAEVRSGTEFGVYLNRAISMPKFREVNP